MKKFNLQCFALTTLAFVFNFTFAQQQANLIVGEPNIYQDFLILNPDADSSIVKWEVDVYSQYYDTVTKSVEQELLASHGTRGLESYIRLDPEYRANFDDLKITVAGIDKSEGIVAVDEWIESVPPYQIRNEPFCLKSCIGKTYAFDIVINERVNLMGEVQNGHTVSFKQHSVGDGSGGYIPKYRHLTFNEATNINNNSVTDCGYDSLETYCHYGLANPFTTGNISFFGQNEQDGVKIIKRTGVTTADQLKDRNGVVLTGTVYSIQKHLGKWQGENSTMSNVLANEPSIPCGDFGGSITSMINHANSYIDLDNDFSCNGFGSGDPHPWDDLPFNVWSDLHDDWVEWDEDIYDILDTMEQVFNDHFDDNTTGVDWWPSDDVSQIQLINISKGVDVSSTKPTVVLYKDSLFNSNGEPNYNSISLSQGLYNVHFTLSGGYSFPLILSKTESETVGFAHKNFLSVNIHPNPISSGNLTVELEADATLNFDYKILDGQGSIVYQKANTTILKDNTVDLIVPVDDFPSGSLVHVFEMSDGSSVSYTTIKN